MHPFRRGPWAYLVLLSLSLAGVASDEFYADDWDLQERVARVSDGELRFLTQDAAADAHAHINKIQILATSLEDGWVGLSQCHRNLDAVPAAQIVFHAERSRGFEVTSASKIGRAWVDGHTVQLEDVEPQATLCIQGQTRAFWGLGDGRFRLRNGPYMRKFLDGYYPMRVVLEVSWDAEALSLIGTWPAEQTGLSLKRRRDGLVLDAVFEGRLRTCLDFCRADLGDCVFEPLACVVDSPSP